MTTTTATNVYLVTIIDGAAFSARIGSPRAFATWAEASEQGRLRVAVLQGERRAKGEKDEAFVSAIEYRVDEVELGAQWVRRAPAPPVTSRVHHARAINRASEQLRRIRDDRFGGFQYARDPEGYKDGIRSAIATARMWRLAGLARLGGEA